MAEKHAAFLPPCTASCKQRTDSAAEPPPRATGRRNGSERKHQLWLTYASWAPGRPRLADIRGCAFAELRALSCSIFSGHCRSFVCISSPTAASGQLSAPAVLARGGTLACGGPVHSWGTARNLADPPSSRVGVAYRSFQGPWSFAPPGLSPGSRPRLLAEVCAECATLVLRTSAPARNAPACKSVALCFRLYHFGGALLRGPYRSAQDALACGATTWTKSPSSMTA